MPGQEESLLDRNLAKRVNIRDDCPTDNLSKVSAGNSKGKSEPLHSDPAEKNGYDSDSRASQRSPNEKEDGIKVTSEVTQTLVRQKYFKAVNQEFKDRNLTRVKANPGVTDEESKENYVYSSKPYSYCVYGCQECDFKGRYMNRNLFCF